MAGQYATLQVEQSNILWRIVVTAKQVKIKLTLFPLKLYMMVTSWIVSYWGYNWFVQYFEAWGKVLLWHCDLVTRCYSVLVKKHQLSIIYWNISNVKLRPNYWLPFTFRSWKELHSILYCAIKFEEILWLRIKSQVKILFPLLMQNLCWFQWGSSILKLKELSNLVGLFGVTNKHIPSKASICYIFFQCIKISCVY